jgi:hypothetical protein
MTEEFIAGQDIEGESITESSDHNLTRKNPGRFVTG